MKFSFNLQVEKLEINCSNLIKFIYHFFKILFIISILKINLLKNLKIKNIHQDVIELENFEQKNLNVLKPLNYSEYDREPFKVHFHILNDTEFQIFEIGQKI